MKLDKLQTHKLDRSLSDLQSLLTQIKQKTLKGKRLNDMKILETIVQSLEVFKICSS